MSTRCISSSIWYRTRNRPTRSLKIFPSIIFDKYASTPPKGSPRDLDLDSGIRKYGIPLKNLLCGFRDRWELIVDFQRFEGLMESPEDLEDVLTVRESEESGDESISLKDYERGR